MQFWLEVFSIIAAIALVVQVVILTLLFFELRRTSENTNRLVTDLQSRVGPILTRVQILLDDTSRMQRTGFADSCCMRIAF